MYHVNTLIDKYGTCSEPYTSKYYLKFDLIPLVDPQYLFVHSAVFVLSEQAAKLCPSCSSKCYIWVWSLSKYTCLKASAVGGKWGEIPGCPCVRNKERERAGERESTLEHLQLSCKSHCRALLLRYDFIAAPTGVEIEVITSSLLPEHWAANSLIPAINCICVPCVRLYVCVCVYVS